MGLHGLLFVLLAVAAATHDTAGGADRDDAEAVDLRAELAPELLGLPDGPDLKRLFDRALVGDASVAPAVLALRSHPNAAVARWGACLAGRFPDSGVSEALRQTLTGEPRPTVRLGALLGLHRLRDAAGIAAALSDPDPGLRATAVLALGDLGDARQSPALLACLDRRDLGCPAELVLDALGALGDPPGSTAVRDRLAREANDKTKAWAVRVEIASNLHRLGHAAAVQKVLDRDAAMDTVDSLDRVHHAVEAAARETGKVVDSQGMLDDLRDRALRGRRREDGWNHPIRLRFVGRGVFEAQSDGPDGRPGTADDLSSAEPLAAWERRVFASVEVDR